jgi:hypothetical protein
MLYKSAASGMAGCCEGRDTQNCGWARSCVDFKSYAAGSCGTNCILDTFVRKCTNIASPYCVTWTYPSDGIADYGCDDTSTNTIYTIRQTAKDSSGGTTSTRLPTAAVAAVTFPTGSSSNTTTRKTAKKLAIGTIIGIVIAVLFIIFFVIIGIVMCMKKKKKQQQIAANAQIVANVQAGRPESQYQPQPPHMQQGPPPPMPTQNPPPTNNGYFAPPNQQEQKYNAHASVHEYAMTPISNPSTPAPAYAQPYGSPNPPPMPQQHTGQYQPPTNGAYEVPSPVPQQHTGQYQPPVNGAHEAPSPVPQQHTGQYHPPANGAHEVASLNMAQSSPQHQVVSPIQQYPSPNVGAHEVDAISVPHAPGRTGPLYEMGGR